MAEESHFRLRIPSDLKARIEAAARDAGRSLNAQVVYTLQEALKQADELVELRAYAEDHDTRIEKLERDVYSLLDHAGLLPDRWRD